MEQYTAVAERYWQGCSPSARHETDVALHASKIRSHLPAVLTGSGIDYGCGGGAGLDAMLAAGCSDVLGVDVALATAGSGTHRVIHPSDLGELAAGSFHAVVCTSVFQHLVDQEHALAVLSELSRLAAVGADALIQVRYYQPGDNFDPATREPDYERRAFRSHAWQVADFWRTLEAAHFEPLTVKLEPYRHYAWFSAKRAEPKVKPRIQFRYSR